MEHEHYHEHNQKSDHESHSKKHEDHSNYHAHKAQNFLKRFCTFIALSVTISALSPLFKEFFGWRDSLSFSGDGYVSAFLSSVVISFFGIILNPAVECRFAVYKYRSNSYKLTFTKIYQ
tara:strand:+ start:37909 stop:38265 length:357 start_codon:yes stop_codon:yes gene_type:complete